MTLLTGLLTLLAWQPASANHGTRTLQVLKEINSTQAGASATLTLTAMLSGAADAGSPIRIAFEVEGGPADGDGLDYNTADKFCTVDEEETECTVSFTSATPGSGLVRAWIDHDKKDLQEPDSVFEADLEEGRLADSNPETPGDFATTADCRTLDARETRADQCLSGTEEPGTTEEPDDTDVVALNFTGGANNLDCVDSNSANGTDAEVNRRSEDETYTCRATSASGAPLSNRAIDAENLDGPNDPDSSAADGEPDYDTTTLALPPGEFCRTDSTGTCTATIDAANGDFGSSDASICFWLDEAAAEDEDVVFDPDGAAVDGGDCAEAVTANDGDPTDVVSLGWRNTTAVGTSLDVAPETPTGSAGSNVTLTATIFDQYGDKFLGNTNVFSEVFQGSAGDADGNNLATADASCSTAGGSSCNLVFASSTSGTSRQCSFLNPAPALSGNAGNGTCDGEGLGDGLLNNRDVTRISWLAASSGGGGSTTTTTTPEDVAKTQGYSLVGADGGIFNYGTSAFHGSTGDKKLNQPVIGMANKKGGTGYWLVARDGGIFTFGDADFYGSTGDKTLNAPILGMEATPTGKGYWLFAADGGIFTFGDAEFFGSTGDMKLNAPAVGMAINEKGDGYWLVAQDGGIFSFGNVPFHGSTGSMKLNQPVFDMASTTGDKGYWLVAKDGGIFSFGDAEAKFAGSAVGSTTGTVIGMGATPTSNGYWIADNKGAVFPFGDAKFLGDRRNDSNNAPTVGFATVPK